MVLLRRTMTWLSFNALALYLPFLYAQYHSWQSGLPFIWTDILRNSVLLMAISALYLAVLADHLIDGLWGHLVILDVLLVAAGLVIAFVTGSGAAHDFLVDARLLQRAPDPAKAAFAQIVVGLAVSTICLAAKVFGWCTRPH